MYDNQNAAYSTQPLDKQPSALQSIGSTMFNYLNDQSSLIGRIESRLHEILNKRVPEKQSVPPNEITAPMTDAVTKLQKETQRIFDHNSILERIEKHLSEII